MMYNQTRTSRMPMPLLMGLTKLTPQENILTGSVSPMYDPFKQIVIWDMSGTKNTKSARGVPGTSNGGRCSDMKSVNDDIKYL